MRSLNLMALTVCFISIIVLGNAAHAMSCKSFLTLAAKNDRLNPLEKLQAKVGQAKSLQEASDLTYDKVVLGNMIFDQVIDGIIALNTQTGLDQLAAQNLSSQTQAMISALQNAFHIPSYIMGFAISNRLELENAEILVMLKAGQTKETIGFFQNKTEARNDSSVVDKQPIGFVINPKSESEQRQSENFFEGLITNLEAQPANQNIPPKQTFGFIPARPSQKQETVQPLKQIGFVQPKTEEKAFTAEDLPQIALNVKRGEFIIRQDKNKAPTGFHH